MIKGIYSVKDLKSGYDAIMLAENDDIAVRMFTTAVRGGNNLFADFPQDFVLVKVGTFDTGTGQVVPGLSDIVSAEVLIQEE